jgi:hypothetical protein
LSRRKTHFSFRFILLGVVAGTFVGYGASAVRATFTLAEEGATGSMDELQATNVVAKSDRLPFLMKSALTAAGDGRDALASATTLADLDRFYDLVTTATPMLAAVEPAKSAPVAEPVTAYASANPVHTASLPPPKPKLLPPPPPAPPQVGLLDDAQIAGIKSRLQLTPEQASYWPAIESALRDVARVHLRNHRKTANGKVNIDVNSREVQKLIWAAMPLLGQLREDQKREVRKLVRVIGLEQVASQI